jgi:hypothetical protein
VKSASWCENNFTVFARLDQISTDVKFHPVVQQRNSDNRKPIFAKQLEVGEVPARAPK